jgi:hypothetical protein
MSDPIPAKIAANTTLCICGHTESVHAFRKDFCWMLECECDKYERLAKQDAS